ncbi:MAG: chemotaxis protein [Geobacteraceae bacterium]|nr:chemotaxis protein [Geobacteraceae bacterium]
MIQSEVPVAADDKQKILLESGTNELEIVEFRIDELDRNGEIVPCYYGVNVAKVREIIRRPKTWKIPNSHPAIEGMMQLRDAVLAVINLSHVLGKNNDELTPDRVVVLEFNRMNVGVLVHSVSSIYRISWERVEPPVKVINDVNVTGVVKMDDRIILILDFEKIVAEICGHEVLYQISGEQMTEELTLDRSKRRILVADDSRFIRNNICSSLRAAGYRVEEAENGSEAWDMITGMLERCRREGVPYSREFDMLITDIEMPKMDGLHLTSLVRKEEALRGLPVLIFSSLASEDNKRKWRDLGANDIVTKPDLPNLVQLADSLMH